MLDVLDRVDQSEEEVGYLDLLGRGLTADVQPVVSEDVASAQLAGGYRVQIVPVPGAKRLRPWPR